MKRVGVLQKGDDETLKVAEEFVRAAYLMDLEEMACRISSKENAAADIRHLRGCLSGETGEHILGMIAEESSGDMLPLLLRKAKEIASAVDKRGKSGEKELLANIFNRFSGASERPTSYYMPEPLAQDICQYPRSDGEEENGTQGYGKILQTLMEKFQDQDVCQRGTDDFLRIMETALSYVPASDTAGGLSDISLYDHGKLTAAIAACLHQYIGAMPPEDALSWLRGDAVEIYRSEVFLLVSGDISGVQQFIYTIPSKGALKSLRGRSFYLDILLEHAADELLQASGLTRTNLLYTGGGHFYLLMPNTVKQTDILHNFSDSINEWFLKHYGSRLYLALAWTPSVAEELMGLTDMGAGAPFQRVSAELSRQKLCRYSEKQLQDMFTANSVVNKTLDGSRECSICHSSSMELSPYYDDDEETLACGACRSLYRMGQKMLEDDAFLVSTAADRDAIPLPGYGRSLYLSAVNWRKVPKDREDVVRLYVKNQLYADHPKAVYLWLADYTARKGQHVLEFGELAALSGGSREGSGICRLGVLRADVDNLGAAFLAGFPEGLATLTRTGALSRQLSIFFKRYIMFLCRGKLPQERFRLFPGEKKGERNVHVVYSGGDDLFLVGAWDDLIELAVDMRQAFSRFTNDKLTFSAGIGFFPAKCPVAAMARQTGELEDAAKDNDKDSIALFGSSTEVYGASMEQDCPERFHWSEFIGKVCGEKLLFLQRHFVFPQEEHDKSRLPIGKSGLYRLLALIENDATGQNSVNIARFAYVLARLDPGDRAKDRAKAYREIREQLYRWYMKDQDRHELRCALKLVIYNLREKKEDA